MKDSSAKCNNFNVSSIEVTALSHGTCHIRKHITNKNMNKSHTAFVIGKFSSVICELKLKVV